METGSHAIANPTMWKAVEIILGIALVTPENITNQFAEAVLTWTPGSKYNACCIKVMYAAHKKSWWVQVSGWPRRKLKETKGIKRIQKVLLSPFMSVYLEDPFHEHPCFKVCVQDAVLLQLFLSFGIGFHILQFFFKSTTLGN